MFFSSDQWLRNYQAVSPLGRIRPQVTLWPTHAHAYTSSKVRCYGVPNNSAGTIIKSQKKILPARVLFRTNTVWAQGRHDRYIIINHFMDQENLQMYAQMYGILNALSLKYHTQYSLKNGRIHLVILIVW